jgi:hypothetical protein
MPGPSQGPRRRVDVELVALLAGLKPAVRLSAAAGPDASAAAARLERAGAHVVRARGFIPSEGRPRELLWAALDPRVAAELREAEEPTLAEPCLLSRPELAARLRRTGELLGYPGCCVEAFVRRSGEELDVAPGLAEIYRAARAAWVERPEALLNTLLRPLRVQLVSHEPCRFDCAPSRAYALACLAAVARRDGEAASALASALARAVVVAPDGARAIVAVAAGRVAAASPAGVREPDDSSLAAALAGRAVGARGAIEGAGTPPPLLVDFGAA